MNYAGLASAATLGYIHGDIKGAVRWAKTYQKMHGSTTSSKRRKVTMSAGTQRRGRSRSFTPTPATKRNRSVSVSSRRSSLLSSAPSRASDRSLGSRASTVAKARTKKKVVKFHHPKSALKVKVNKKFQKKVLKVLEEKEPHGYGQELYLNVLPFTNLLTKNLQEAQPIYANQVDGLFGQFFSYTQILHAAATLWNKAGTANLAIQNYLDANMFNAQNFKVEVVKQWVSVKYRNNSQRTFTVNIYASQRKSKTVNGVNMLDDWKGALTNDAGCGVNVTTTTYNQIYNTPYLCKAVTDNWKIETTKVVLAPGEEYVYTVAGPSKMYDFRKNWINAVWCNGDRDIIDLSHVAYTDLVGTSTGDIGRVSEKSNTIGYGLIYETNLYYKLSMPEQAGISWNPAAPVTTDTQVLPAAGGNTKLGNRRDAYYFFTNPGTVSTGTVVRIDRENPEDIKGL